MAHRAQPQLDPEDPVALERARVGQALVDHRGEPARVVGRLALAARRSARRRPARTSTRAPARAGPRASRSGSARARWTRPRPSRCGRSARRRSRRSRCARPPPRGSARGRPSGHGLRGGGAHASSPRSGPDAVGEPGHRGLAAGQRPGLPAARLDARLHVAHEVEVLVADDLVHPVVHALREPRAQRRVRVAVEQGGVARGDRGSSASIFQVQTRSGIEVDRGVRVDEHEAPDAPVGLAEPGHRRHEPLVERAPSGCRTACRAAAPRTRPSCRGPPRRSACSRAAA